VAGHDARSASFSAVRQLALTSQLLAAALAFPFLAER
jgi:hypothetical protein